MRYAKKKGREKGVNKNEESAKCTCENAITHTSSSLTTPACNTPDPDSDDAAE
jgi:hypothetical protein